MRVMFLLSLIVLSACNASWDFDIPYHDTPPGVAVFPPHLVEGQYLDATYDQNVTGYWHPSLNDVMRLDRALPDFLRTDPRTDDIADEITSYYRQFAGITIDGQNVIYGSYLCHEYEGWQQMLIHVEDGGNCFFQVMYTPREGFIYLYVNGEG